MRRFLDILNTPMAVLVVLAIVVTVNVFLFFGCYLPAVTGPAAPSPPAPRTELTTSAPEATGP